MGSLNEPGLSLVPIIENRRDTSQSFEKTFGSVLSDISVVLKNKPQSTLKDWVTLAVKYNVPNGKQIRGKLLVAAYSILSGIKEGEQFEEAEKLGWCVEILQAACLVVDDLMDNGITRRGKPCWYRVNNMGSIVANDGFILEHLTYQIIKHHFGSSKLYSKLLDIILEVTFNTTLGQSLDTRYSGRNDNIEFSDESIMQLYLSIATLKTSYYTIYLPIALAMVLAGVENTDGCGQTTLWKSFEDIALKIGTFFQIQDDYFDCFSDTKTMGKEGSDIQEGKCSWLYAKAMELCSPEQERVLRENYGMTGIENVSTIKGLYVELDLPKEFVKIRNEMAADILTCIDNLDHESLKNVMRITFAQIFERTF